MAKQIKAIKCPQCGSVKATPLEPDYYKCDSCGARFFLDSDDININVRDERAKPQVDPRKMVQVFIGLALVLVFFMFLLPALLPGPSGSSHQISQTESWWSEKRYFFEAEDKTPVALMVGSRSKGSEKDRNIAAFYDARNGKELKILGLGDDRLKESEYRVFDDGTPYLIVNKARLYRVNRKTKNLTEVTPQDFPSQPSLQSGWAKIEFVYKQYGSGLNIMTNAGRQVFFYPLTDLLFGDASSPHEVASADFPAGMAATTKTGFVFSLESMEFKDALLQLIRYTYAYMPGYPRNAPTFRARSVRSHNPDPVKALITPQNQQSAKMIAYEDMTPGRAYFDPKVLGFNEKYLVIAFRSTPAEKSPLQLQLLDARNANILWTITAPVKDYSAVGVHADRAWLSESGVFIPITYNALFVGYDGKIIHEMNKD